MIGQLQSPADLPRVKPPGTRRIVGHKNYLEAVK
jgi:hypothetical protein